MKKITIAGPDKIALAIFMDFLRHCLGNTYMPVMLHSLMSKESLVQVINDAIEEKDTIIFSYYARRKVNIDPLTCIPEKLMTISNAVVWFDLYATDFKLLKDESGFEITFRDRWKKNIERINKLMEKR